MQHTFSFNPLLSHSPINACTIIKPSKRTKTLHLQPAPAMADPQLDPATPPGLHLISAFFAMEPSHAVISLARLCGGGSVTLKVQRFISDHCITTADGKCHQTYVKNFVKKLIIEAESNCIDVLEELYEYYAHCLTSFKDDGVVKENLKACKSISFLFPDSTLVTTSSPKSRKLDFSVHCSLNMLEGDTGCSIWPSSLFLSEFILSFPDIFSKKSCFEVGSGVGLVGLCLAHVKASKIILSDGDLSTLANMKRNLELNQMSFVADALGTNAESSIERCIHLPWESAEESELQEFMPEIVLGADVIYDPQCLPHLVRVLSILIKKRKSSSMPVQRSSHQRSDENGSTHEPPKGKCYQSAPTVAYIASVIRNVETFNSFVSLVDKANLTIKDLTLTHKPLDLLPYMQSYHRPSIRILELSCG